MRNMKSMNRSDFDENTVTTWDWQCPSCSTYQTEHGSNFGTDDSVICECCSQSYQIIEDKS